MGIKGSQTVTEHVVDTAGDGVAAEIEYRDGDGRVVGFWAYGSWDPDYPYQGRDLSTVGESVEGK